MPFLFPYNRAFPNGRVTFDDDGASEPGCLVDARSKDGAVGVAPGKENIALDVPDYRAAKATRERPRWRLVRGSDRDLAKMSWLQVGLQPLRQLPDFPQSVDCLR
jgi:hypothetical protein